MQRREFIKAATVSTIALALPTQAAQAINFWAFLGESDLFQPIKTTIGYGIPYQANGFDRPRKNRIRKTVARMEARGASHLINDFTVFANTMTVDNFIPEWIDLAYLQIYQRWLAAGSYTLPGARMSCGQAAQQLTPQSLFVEVAPIPFEVRGYPAGTYYAGVADGLNIKCINVNADGFESNPPTSSLRKFSDLVRWEIGNAFANFVNYDHLRYGEIGDRQPGRIL